MRIKIERNWTIDFRPIKKKSKNQKAHGSTVLEAHHPSHHGTFSTEALQVQKIQQFSVPARVAGVCRRWLSSPDMRDFRIASAKVGICMDGDSFFTAPTGVCCGAAAVDGDFEFDMEARVIGF